MLSRATIFAVVTACLSSTAIAQNNQVQMVEVNGKKYPAQSLRTMAKKAPVAMVLNPKGVFLNKPVQLEGLWRAAEGEAPFLQIEDARTRASSDVALDLTLTPNAEFRDLAIVKVYGILTGPSQVQAVLIDLAPPGLAWEYALENPGQVVAGEAQTFVVNLKVKNTGKQIFKAVEGKVRLWQINSPNDKVEDVTIENLRPGEVRLVRVPIELFNFSVIGQTSVPQCAFIVTDFE